jgi:hypothetical protein
LIVCRTIQLSDWTSIEYAPADSIPAIEVLSLTRSASAVGHRRSLPLPATKRGDTLPRLEGEYPLKKAKKRGYPRFLAWLLFLRLSVLCYRNRLLTLTTAFRLLLGFWLGYWLGFWLWLGFFLPVGFRLLVSHIG